MPGPQRGHGSGIFAQVKELAATVAEHGERLDAHDEEIAAIDADVLTLTNVSLTLSEVCARAEKRRSARVRLAKIRARRSK
jgi:hypothetical protein